MVTYENIIKKIITVEEAMALFTSEFRKRNKVIFTNGCFDLLHRGHVYNLSRAREMGDILVVGLN
ncbi:MAG: adenylyltransferase/cytidyltransferase family protein, partial [Bacteroidales bacterium]|nr:adenylyltransferase/cytidyltransferase family protein [Bacteroidales bacterium]